MANSKKEDTSDACQTEACSLQTCLNKNTYHPEKCEQHVRKLYKCCQEMYKAHGGNAETSACPKEEVVERWFKMH